MNTLFRVIELEYDYIEIHYNEMLTIKPYLVRVFNYNNYDPQEIRLEEKDIKNLYSILKKNKFI